MTRRSPGNPVCDKGIIVAVFILLAVLPVPVISAANGTVIEQGATIFIGEEGLNVTHALNQAYYAGQGTPAQNNSAPPLTAIGWWASAADLYTTSPSRTIDLATRYRAFTVAPSDFVGYTGSWYLLDAPGTRPIGATGAASMTFSIQDPSLDLRIWDYDQNLDVSGKVIPQGGKLGFRVDTNMYPALDGRYRTNVIDNSHPGKWASSVLYANPGTNVMIDTSGTWTNGTVTIADPTQPCCRQITLENRVYTNYTDFGALMTWANGHPGCRRLMNGPMYYNISSGRFVRNNSLGIGPSGPNLTPVTWAQVRHIIRDYCTQSAPDAATDGYIDIRVRDEANAQITRLYNTSFSQGTIAGPYTVMKNFVATRPFFWGSGTAGPVILNADGEPVNGHVWDTGALDTFGQSAYPVGTYTVCAASTLNRMKDNYKQGGADYTGKTVSPCHTVSLVTEGLHIEANKDTVVRSKTFSVTVTGIPGTDYWIWVKNTGAMTCRYNDQPPMIAGNQEGVRFDPSGGSAVIGTYQFQNGHGKTIFNDTPNIVASPTTFSLPSGYAYYGNFTTSTSGIRTIEFVTTDATRAQDYTIRVERTIHGNFRKC